MTALSNAAPHLTAQAMVAAHLLAQTLADGRAFIGGDAAGAGDLALYANMWFVANVPTAAATAAAMQAMPHVADWYARVAGHGHGMAVAVSGADALAAARGATPIAVAGSVEPPLAAGMIVAVTQEGTKDAPTTGRLLRCDAGGISIARTLESGSTVHVHFPRLGQIVQPV
jgi:glutathione S-transferase